MEVKQEPLEDLNKENITIENEEKLDSIDYENWNNSDNSYVATNLKLEDELQNVGIPTGNCDEVEPVLMPANNITKIKEQDDQYLIKTEILEEPFDLPSIISEGDITTFNKQLYRKENFRINPTGKIKNEQDDQYVIKTELLHETCDLPIIKSEDEASTSLYNLFHKENIQSRWKNRKLVGTKKKTCPICFKNFQSTKKRNQHFNLHFSKPPSSNSTKNTASYFRKCIVICRLCGQFFIRKKEFLLHMLHYSINNYVQTLKANQPTKSKNSLTGLTHDSNFRRPIRTLRFECGICSHRFTQKSHLRAHLRIHTSEKPFKCDICSRRFTQKSTLTVHQRIHTNDRPFKCEICFKSFKHKNSHMSTHSGDKPFKCEICSKCFSVRSTLSAHMDTHNDEKPFKCEICCKCFKKAGNLTAHVRTHTGNKPFKCQICSKPFLTKSSLNVHMRVHTSEKRFKCEICYTRFKHEGTLSTHMHTHTGKKPFKCKTCGKCFSRRSTLSDHMLIHTNEKPFKCSICCKYFRQKFCLTTHMRTHSGDKPFKCTTCCKCFSQQSSLSKHMRNHASKKLLK